MPGTGLNDAASRISCCYLLLTPVIKEFDCESKLQAQDLLFRTTRHGSVINAVIFLGQTKWH